VKQVQENKPARNYSCLSAKVILEHNELIALFDTGANVSLINRQYLEDNFEVNYLEKESLDQPHQGMTADGSPLPFLLQRKCSRSGNIHWRNLN
jgi:hypothetical protein